jgi:uncharacterized protein (DUF952 family)
MGNEHQAAYEQLHQARREKLKHKRLGLRVIDASAVRRMLTFSIAEAEKHLDNLYAALDIIDSACDPKSKTRKK